MAASINEKDPDSERLRWAIEQVQQELPLLLGSDYRTFSIELELLLPKGSDDELLALFASHPVAYDRLWEYLNYLIAGHGLYGNPISKGSGTRYFCQAGQHYVDAADVQKRDPAGRPICPSHGKVMRMAP
jgi:hypothetical protein